MAFIQKSKVTVKDLVRELRKVTRDIDQNKVKSVKYLKDAGMSQQMIVEGYIDEVIYTLKGLLDERFR